MMKTAKNLFEKIIAFDNLLLASRKAQKGKKYKPNVAHFNVNLEKELLALERELQAETYQPGNYRTFYITDPKVRMISAAPYRDRVVHHALCNIIEPIFDKSMIFDTYANRKGKGTHKAIYRCQHFLRQNNWYLKCDIQKYFPSIDHKILKQAIRQKISCAKTLRLIDRIIDNSNPQEPIFDYFPDDDLFSRTERRHGLPMGNLTSQYFANLYLSAFDHFVKNELRSEYIRYVDDFIIFGNSKQQMHDFRKRIEYFLEKKRLKIHKHKTIIAPSEEGVSFLGQRIFKTHRRLRSENVRLFWKRLNKKVEQFRNDTISATHFEQSLNAWRGHALQANTEGLVRLTDKIIIFKKGLNWIKTERNTFCLLEA